MKIDLSRAELSQHCLTCQIGRVRNSKVNFEMENFRIRGQWIPIGMYVTTEMVEFPEGMGGESGKRRCHVRNCTFSGKIGVARKDGQ